MGAVQLFLGAHNVFASYDPATKRVSHALNLAAVHLADGIIRDWWRILGGRDRRHSLLRHRNGYVLPDIGFRFDGTDFEVSVSQPRYGDEGVRFFFATPEFVTRADLESALAEFVVTVERRLVEAGIQNSPLSSAWARVAASRADPEEAAFCEAAGALHLDPYRIAETDARVIEQSGQLFRGEALIEFLAGLVKRGDSGASSTPYGPVLAGLSKTIHSSGKEALLPALPGIAKDIGRSGQRHPGEKAYAPGYRAAGGLRSILGAQSCSNVPSVTSLANSLGNSRFGAAEHDLGVNAVVSREGDAVRVHLNGQGGPDWGSWAQNFAFARALGDAVCFPDTGNSVINRLHGAERQATNRAFAAQFLAPVDEVLGMRESGRSLSEVARAFGVASAVIEHQEENKERIWEACARAA